MGSRCRPGGKPTSFAFIFNVPCRRKQIESMHEEDRLPILVGGTAYWIHHLLFPHSLPAQSEPMKSNTSAQPSQALADASRQLPPELSLLFQNLPANCPTARENPTLAYNLHDLLSRLDPEMAQRWHWKDTRKVVRNLEILRERGRPASEILIEADNKAESRP